MSTHLNGDWLRCHRPRTAPAVRLVCFPHAGGSASFYRAWPASLPESVEVHTVQYPGREERLDDPMVDDMDSLVSSIVTALESLGPGPISFFGHSMGGAVAYEASLRLREIGRPTPLRLFISGRQPPEHHRGGDLHTRGEAAIADELRKLSPDNAARLEEADLARMILPIVRNDYKLIETYRPRPADPLACPITVFLGDGDTELTAAQARDWAHCSTTTTRTYSLPGDHFYLVGCLDAVTEIVGGTLVRDLAAHRAP